MRVSIVATALDGQQPEPKSVINMVHRIQNRNPGYSEFVNNGSTQSYAFSNPNNSIITHGANALKLEEEVKPENLEASNVNEAEMSDFSSTLVEQTEHQNENVESTNNPIEEKIENEINNSALNGLENFQIDEEDAPELFNSDNSEHNEHTFSSTETSENNKEEDDLEIPAFLRRQKN
jgi:cell division protein FtsZ